MIIVTVKGDTKDILKDLTYTKKSVIPYAQNAAINRTAQGVRTRAKRQAAQQLGIAQKWLTPRIKLTRSNLRTLTAYLFALTQGIYLYKIWGQKGLARAHQSAFIATMPNTHTGIFKRRTPRRLPIDEQKLDVHDALTRAFDTFMQTFAPGEYKKVFAREMERRSKLSPARRRRRR